MFSPLQLRAHLRYTVNGKTLWLKQLTTMLLELYHKLQLVKIDILTEFTANYNNQKL